MTDVGTLLLILGAIALGAMSPGPSVIYVTRLAVADSRRGALGAALGMGLGSVVFAIAATLGLGAVLHYAGWAFLGLKFVGGAYLLYLGVRMFLHAGTMRDDDEAPAPEARRAILPAALTQLSNPKAIVVYTSVFAALLPTETPLWMLITLPIAVFAVETGWYLIVALAFSTRRPRELYARFAKVIDRVAGATLGVLGAAFAIDAGKTALSS